MQVDSAEEAHQHRSQQRKTGADEGQVGLDAGPERDRLAGPGGIVHHWRKDESDDAQNGNDADARQARELSASYSKGWTSFAVGKERKLFALPDKIKLNEEHF